MASAAEYKQRIQQLDWQTIGDFWERIKASETPDWDAGKAFEYFVLRRFELDGADIIYPYSVYLAEQEIEQIDGVMYYKNIACLVESKNQEANINFGPIAKLRSQLMRRPASVIGCIFSTSSFTDAASTLVNFTAPQTILLWSGEEVDVCIEKKAFCRFLEIKYRHCIEYGVHDFNIVVETIPEE